VVVGLLAFASPAFADTTYSDAAGEDAASADITNIVVSNDPVAHTITIKVQIANMPTFDETALVGFAFDGDHNPATGDPTDPAGLDSQFVVGTSGWEFDRWDGTQFAQVTGLGIGVNYVDGLLTVVFHETDLGTTAAFDFLVLSLRGPDPANPVVDLAPDGASLYAYTLTKPAVKPAVTASTVAFRVAPKAGKSVAVGPLSVTLSDGTSVTTNGEHCSATLGGTHLSGRGAGGCTFVLPKKAKGKKLAVKVTGSYGTVTLSKNVTAVVR
jgi:hypothetical protein